jgi:uncharacterized sulfatase
VEIPEEIVPFPEYLRDLGYYCTNNAKEDYNFIDTTMWDESSKEAHWRNRNGKQPFFSVFNLGMTHQSQIFGTFRQFDNTYGHLLSDEERCQPQEIVLPPFYSDSPTVRMLWARYYDLVTIMDKEVGNILRQLDEDGLSDNTIVFFYSDHGMGLPRGKRALYDFGIKIPLIVKAPGKYQQLFGLKPGTGSDKLVNFADFAPTILAIAGISSPAYMQGSSFLEAPSKNENKGYIFATSDRVDEAFELSRVVILKDYKYIRNYMPHLPLLQPNFYTDQSEIMQELYRISDYQALSPFQQAMFRKKRLPEELYDLKNDPHELNNLVKSEKHKDMLISMRKAHINWVRKTYDTGLMPEYIMHDLSNHATPYDIAKV